MLNFHIISIFPESFESYLNSSILKRAQTAGLIKIHLYHLRDFTLDKHRNVDGRPYGGGPGMVMAVQPIILAVAKIKSKIKNQKSKIILFAPNGEEFNNQIAEKLANPSTPFNKAQSKKLRARSTKHLILICGHYEGIDARVKKILKAEEYTIGPYVLTGGELPAMVAIETISRLVPGVIGKEQLLKERISKTGGFLEYAQYTRPEVYKVFKGNKVESWRVPKVLLSGDHKKIGEWKMAHGKVIEK
ncbi:MAG: tRNA (guanosine(37)-N1)-methyltransferase TrmD [Candidatus Vogelbacteria bacterium]|nr:tRNA (guanosine(37)-N1)-methyltransferase TrmD [Candidatus Vogelbacteria bacterium]